MGIETMSINLTLPRSIYEQAMTIANKEGLSINQWVAYSVAEAIVRSKHGFSPMPTNRLEAIAQDSFCDMAECSTDEPKIGICCACDAIYAAREALNYRKEKDDSRVCSK